MRNTTPSETMTWLASCMRSSASATSSREKSSWLLLLLSEALTLAVMASRDRDCECCDSKRLNREALNRENLWGVRVTGVRGGAKK